MARKELTKKLYDFYKKHGIHDYAIRDVHDLSEEELERIKQKFKEGSA